jgi:hypothetical protein
LTDPQTADELGLTEAQKKKIDAIREEISGQVRQQFKGPPGKDSRGKDSQGKDSQGPEGWKKVQETREAAAEKLLALLTSDQQERWKEMLGAPFTGEIRFGPPGGGPGRGFGPPPGVPGGGAPLSGPRGGPPPSGPPPGGPGADAPPGP